MTSENLLVTIARNLTARSVDDTAERLFLQQAQHCYIRTEQRDLPCCGVTDVFIVKVDDIEYAIPSDDSSVGYECLEGGSFDNTYNNIRFIDQTKDYDDKSLFPKRMKPDPCKILEKVNKVYM